MLNRVKIRKEISRWSDAQLKESLEIFRIWRKNSPGHPMHNDVVCTCGILKVELLQRYRLAAILLTFEGYDLTIKNDYVTDCNCETPMCEHAYKNYILASFADPSVGIFATEYSPTLPRNPFIKWVLTHMDEVYSKLDN